MLTGRQINLLNLPSKGRPYPKDIELFVSPMTAKERMATTLERYGNTDANYYDNLMNSITIKGDFDKYKLLFGDIQYLDLGRRLFSFEINEKILIKDLICPHCETVLNFQFLFQDIQFEDFTENCFNKEFKFTEDDVTVKVSPVTIDKYIKISREYLSNGDNIEDLVKFLFAYRACSVTDVVGRTYEDEKSMHEFIYDYFSNKLYKYKDIETLESLDNNIATEVLPFKTLCTNDKCKKEVEVSIEPSMKFHQQ